MDVHGWQSALWHGSLTRKKTNPFVSPLATPAAQLDRSAARERVLEVIRGLLEELGSQGALPILNANSQLDRDLGLGSLERVELLARLETAFAKRLPDRVASEANTPEDLTRAILSSPGTIAEDEETGSALRASVTVQKLHRAATDTGVLSAETLIDVLRYRAAHDAERKHLLITEDGDAGERSFTLTFGELYAAGNRCAAGCAGGRTCRADAADVARVFRVLCRNSSRRSDSRPHLPAVSRRPHRRVRREA